MADFIELAVGARPWQPHPDAEVVSQYNYWNMPTLGVVQLHGQTFLFECLLNPEGESHVWRYVHIAESDHETLEAAEDVHRAADDVTQGSYYTLAFANDDLGVFAARNVETGWSAKSAEAVIRTFMKEVDSAMERHVRDAAELRGALA
ncbi:MAG: hypothetical protein ACRDUY_07395 [Nitriliruptorales bacterium]